LGTQGSVIWPKELEIQTDSTLSESPPRIIASSLDFEALVVREWLARLMFAVSDPAAYTVPTAC